MPRHLLTNFEIQRYYQSKSDFNGCFSRNNLSKIKDGSYVINLDEYQSIGTHYIASFVNGENVTFCNSFGVRHILEEIKKFLRNKNITTNIYRMEAND